MVLEDIVVRLRGSGHKVTPQRIAIIKIVLESQELLSPSALYEKVHQIDPEVGEVTVYRTLNILSDLGLVCMVHTGENTHSYIGRPPEHHDHLICSECGKVINFTGCNLSQLETRLASETGFTIQEHRLDLYGKCRECSKKGNSKLKDAS
jgi:Fur family transcriptional regulator, ferric uptake regulator